MTGVLYVVATPIGNLEDLSARALRLLGEVAVIAAEDTRHTRKLLAHFGVHTRLISCHQHSAASRIASVVERLRGGDDVALVTDAGTPTISDPGHSLVRAAITAGVTVTPIPGPCALVAALSASGLQADRFTFAGFLPRGEGARRAAIGALATLPHPLAFYEAPLRLAATLRSLAATLGDRPAVVARELTKQFEELRRGPLSELAAHYTDRPPLGECVILVAGAEASPAPDAKRLAAAANALLADGLTVREAAKSLRAELGVARRDAYAAALAAAEARSR